MKAKISLIILCLLPVTLKANLGGFENGNVATGMFKPLHTNQIEIVKEDLTIDLYLDRAKVAVIYKMKNTGDATTVKAGFPCLTAPYLDDTVKRAVKDYVEIIGYLINADGAPITFTKTKPQNSNLINIPAGAQQEADTAPDDNSPQKLNLVFLVSELKFKAHETKTIEINYKSKYHRRGRFVSDDCSYDPDTFRYLLSTGSVWKGPIQEGHIVIRPMTVDHSHLTFKPTNRFTKIGNIYVWDFKNLKPSSQDNIEVCMNNGYQTYSRQYHGDYVDDSRSWFSVYENPPRYYLSFIRYKTAASSERSSRYAAYKIRDSFMGTAWVPGGNSGGIGESLTLTLNEPYPISEIGIASGLRSRDHFDHETDLGPETQDPDESLYLANSRPKHLEIVVDGGKPATLLLNDEYTDPIWDDWNYQWIPLPTHTNPVSKVKLTILDVYPGLKYNDTCISEIRFRRKFKFLPKIGDRGKFYKQDDTY